MRRFKAPMLIVVPFVVGFLDAEQADGRIIDVDPADGGTRASVAARETITSGLWWLRSIARAPTSVGPGRANRSFRGPVRPSGLTASAAASSIASELPWRIVDRSPGAGFDNRLLASCGADPETVRTVIVDAQHETGPVQLPMRCRVIDLSGSGAHRFEDGVWSSGYRDGTVTAMRTAGFGDGRHIFLQQDVLEAADGGINQVSPLLKSNFFVRKSYLFNHTSSQTHNQDVMTACYGFGDCFGASFMATSYGNANAPGDEGTVGAAFRARHGDGEFEGRVLEVNDNVVALRPVRMERTVGRDRWLVVTSRDVAREGTIRLIAGTPPVVLGAGTDWVARFGAGKAGGLCFELADGNQSNGNRYIIPVRSIESDTQLTLDFRFLGQDGAWPGDATAGEYRIYKCSRVLSAADSGGPVVRMAVENGALFATGDDAVLPVGYWMHLTGIHVVVEPRMPLYPGYSSGVLLSNLGSPNRPVGAAAFVHGEWDHVLHVLTPPRKSGIRFESMPDQLIELLDQRENAETSLFRLQRNSGREPAFFDVRWQKDGDVLTIGNLRFNAAGQFGAGGIAVQPAWMGYIYNRVDRKSGIYVDLAGCANFLAASDAHRNTGLEFGCDGRFDFRNVVSRWLGDDRSPTASIDGRTGEASFRKITGITDSATVANLNAEMVGGQKGPFARRTGVPPLPDAPCEINDYAISEQFAYFCVAPNMWRRTAFSPW